MKNNSNNLGAFLQAFLPLISKFTLTVDHLTVGNLDPAGVPF
jgi:hypothetical protein